MLARKKTKPSRVQGTPIAEWFAASCGLVLTIGIIGYLLAEGLRERQGPPSLFVANEPAQRTEGGYVLPLVVRNSSFATAAGVEIRGTLKQNGDVVEERRTTFAYVPGRGETRGGLVFQSDPNRLTISLVAEGYEEP
jgi:uncharacterized protein (TIGR02588 family)